MRISDWSSDVCSSDLAWRGRLMAHLPRLQLTLVIGRYAQLAYFPRDGRTLTELVRSWREHPAIMPLPHPSPLNNRWLKKHPWFGQEVLPPLRERVSVVFNPSRYLRCRFA